MGGISDAAGHPLHAAQQADNPALPDDLAQAKRLIPSASLEWFAAHMNGLNEERQAQVIEAAQWILEQEQREF